jgi:hypothetical protein
MSVVKVEATLQLLYQVREQGIVARLDRFLKLAATSGRPNWSAFHQRGELFDEYGEAWEK